MYIICRQVRLLGPEKVYHVRHIQWLECYPDTTVGKAVPSPVMYIYPDFQPEMLHRIMQRLYIFTSCGSVITATY